MSRAEPPCLAVVIPVVDHARRLRETLQSVFAQTGAAGDAIEIVVVDLSGVGLGAVEAARLSSAAPTPLRYIAPPEPPAERAHVSIRRATRAPWIALIGPGAAAAPDWLARLAAARDAFAADLVFGPVLGSAQAAPPAARALVERAHARRGPRAAGLVETAPLNGPRLIRAALAPPLGALAPDAHAPAPRLRGPNARAAWAPNARAAVYAAPADATVRRALAMIHARAAREALDAAGRPQTALAALPALGAAIMMGAAAGVAWALRAPGADSLAAGAAAAAGRAAGLGGARAPAQAPDARRVAPPPADDVDHARRDPAS